MPSTAVSSSAAMKMVLWCTPSIGWMKVNMDDSVNSNYAVCGELFRDYLSMFHAEIMALILDMELAHRKNWYYLWLESDSLNVLRAFEDMNVVPWDLRNRWSNCCT
ncbi:ribonuclease H [Trifolium pratense]|uniref:Ribonuclease H n=1 Tax=Trifolium pratense TaxID=57577 RepID=A0A2K3NFI9_TRIPR|nr:ribonuclease H [Trifolium pratense]